MSVEHVKEKKLFVSIVIPIHNEESILEKNVKGITSQLKKNDYFNWEILLIENGSTDQTLAIAESLAGAEKRIRVIQSSKPSYGRALQLGFLKSEGDLIVNFDIDFWDCEFVSLVAHIMQVKYDIIIASKNLLLSNDSRTFLRKSASYVFRMLLFALFGLRVSDTHGIKAWRNTVKMQKYFRKSKPSHHTYDTEIIVRAMHDECLALEVPIDVKETRAQTRSMMKRVPRALIEIFDLFYRFRWSQK